MYKCVKCGETRGEVFYAKRRSLCKTCSRARQKAYSAHRRQTLTEGQREKQREYKREYYRRGPKPPPKPARVFTGKRWVKARPPRPKPIYGRFGRNHSSTVEKLREYGINDEGTQKSIINLIETMTECPICSQPPTDTNPLVMDHNHANNKFRGVICSNCNRGLGLFRDRAETCRNAAKYLSRSNARRKTPR